MTTRDIVVHYLAGIRNLAPKRGDVLLMVGTTKGAFLLRSDAGRSRWDIAGPYFKGESVYALACDTRQGRNRVYASATSMRWGTLLRTTDDFGKTWTNPAIANVRFPEDSGVSLKNIWQISPGRDADSQTLYCGVEPA